MKLEFKPNVNDIFVALEDISVGELFIYAKEDAVNPPIWMKIDGDNYLCIETNGEEDLINGYTCDTLVKNSKIWKILDATLVIHNHVVNGK